jgi:hypothetical protein
MGFINLTYWVQPVRSYEELQKEEARLVVREHEFLLDLAMAEGKTRHHPELVKDYAAYLVKMNLQLAFQRAIFERELGEALGVND